MLAQYLWGRWGNWLHPDYASWSSWWILRVGERTLEVPSQIWDLRSLEICPPLPWICPQMLTHFGWCSRCCHRWQTVAVGAQMGMDRVPGQRSSPWHWASPCGWGSWCGSASAQGRPAPPWCECQVWWALASSCMSGRWWSPHNRSWTRRQKGQVRGKAQRSCQSQRDLRAKWGHKAWAGVLKPLLSMVCATVCSDVGCGEWSHSDIGWGRCRETLPWESYLEVLAPKEEC